MPDPQFIEPVAIPSRGAVGSPAVRWNQTVEVESIGSRGAVGRPRIGERRMDYFYDPETGDYYGWTISHTSESEVNIGRQVTQSARNAQVGWVRQHQAQGMTVLVLQGSILDPEQLDDLQSFYEDCADHPIVFEHADGSAHEVVITGWDTPRKATLMNPRAEQVYYWTYTIELSVLRTLSGPLAVVT